MDIQLRKCEAKDIPLLVELFRSTVWTINAQDYTQEQLEAWAPDSIDWSASSWQSLLSTNSYVATHADKIVGFANMTNQGYIDFFYVDHRSIRKGVGHALYTALENVASEKGLTKLTTESSITARPFFEKQGFTVIKKREVKRKQIFIERLVMEKALG